MPLLALTRRDGVVQGFTDHDRDLVFDGVTCRAGTGLTGSEATQPARPRRRRLGVAGALADEALTEADLAAGRYDAAASRSIWSTGASRRCSVLTAQGHARRGAARGRGVRRRVARADAPAERGERAALHRDLRRRSRRRALQLDLGEPAFRGTGDGRGARRPSIVLASGLDDFADGWFSAGRLIWTRGANDGLAVEVKSHRVGDDGVALDLWQAMPEPIAAGDTFTVTAGCDKRFATCRDRFDNAVNFRGFPHIPGNDFVIRYAGEPGEPGNDGGSRRAESLRPPDRLRKFPNALSPAPPSSPRRAPGSARPIGIRLR